MFEERVVLGNGVLLEVVFLSVGNFRLSCLQNANLLVEYRGDGKRHLRSLRGRESTYGFKSVEKLRYDFERDAEDALRQG